MADSLLDVLLCVPSATKTHGMLVGSREALHSLEHVLLNVGGPNSSLLEMLRRRMAESDLPISPFRWLDIPIFESNQDDQVQNQSESDYLLDQTALVQGFCSGKRQPMWWTSHYCSGPLARHKYGESIKILWALI